MKFLVILFIIPISLSLPKNADAIKSYLLKQGYTKAGVAGLMGNLEAESALNPRVYEKSKHKRIGLTNEEYIQKTNDGTYKNFVNDRAGFGLAQWTYHSRKQALLNMCRGKIGDLNCQLDYLVKELKGYTKVDKVLRSTNSVNEACDKVLLSYERPAHKEKKIEKRRALCNKYI